MVRYVLDNTDWEVVGLDSFRHAGDPLRNHDDQRYTVLCHDLNAPIGKRTWDKIGRVNYIINLASCSDVDLSIKDPLHVWENNTRLIGNILDYARLESFRDLEAFIQCSTDEVFGPASQGYFHSEWDTICPSNPYSASKAAQEALCVSFWRTYGLPLVITNCMNMVGETQEPTKFFPKIVRAVANGDVVTVHGTPGTVGSRMYLDAKNLADAWVYILRHVKPDFYIGENGPQRPTRFNIVGQEEVTNLELAQRIASIMGKELKFRYEDFHKTRPGHDRRYALDGTRMELLGWKHPIPLDETIRRVVAWTQENPTWL